VPPATSIVLAPCIAAAAASVVIFFGAAIIETDLPAVVETPFNPGRAVDLGEGSVVADRDILDAGELGIRRIVSGKGGVWTRSNMDVARAAYGSAPAQRRMPIRRRCPVIVAISVSSTLRDRRRPPTIRMASLFIQVCAGEALTRPIVVASQTLHSMGTRMIRAPCPDARRSRLDSRRAADKSTTTAFDRASPSRCPVSQMDPHRISRLPDTLALLWHSPELCKSSICNVTNYAWQFRGNPGAMLALETCSPSCRQGCYGGLREPRVGAVQSSTTILPVRFEIALVGKVSVETLH
jgi:hypothetical protein